MTAFIRRREFITLLGAAAAWPLEARAQQPAMPVIGILSAAPALVGEKRMSAFRQGLSEIGFTEGLNVATAILGADGQLDRLPALAAELVRRRVSVVVCPQSSAAVRAVRNATTTIPIIFSSTLDPVALGLVASLARPGGNATGVNNFSTGLAGKRLGLLRELLPAGKVVGYGRRATPSDSKSAS
jgi:putative ABC transport system substrate-binding protein